MKTPRGAKLGCQWVSGARPRRRHEQGDRVSEDKHSEARDTLRLIRDLAEALATQAERYKRLSLQAGATEPSMKRIDALVTGAREIKQQIAALTPSEDEAQGGRVVALKSDRRTARSKASAGGPGVGDAAHTLAIEMKIEGRSRDDVEMTLQETFGLNDATAIVNDVFSSSGS
ncbi:MAG: hypothetical protein QOD76_163 [Solirubrobacteraceae bacterium]|nr:hypothetical protein [Solirubrobacteraceae bacterium]